MTSKSSISVCRIEELISSADTINFLYQQVAQFMHFKFNFYLASRAIGIHPNTIDHHETLKILYQTAAFQKKCVADSTKIVILM